MIKLAEAIWILNMKLMKLAVWLLNRSFLLLVLRFWDSEWEIYDKIASFRVFEFLNHQRLIYVD